MCADSVIIRFSGSCKRRERNGSGEKKRPARISSITEFEMSFPKDSSKLAAYRALRRAQHLRPHLPIRMRLSARRWRLQPVQSFVSAELRRFRRLPPVLRVARWKFYLA